MLVVEVMADFVEQGSEKSPRFHGSTVGGGSHPNLDHRALAFGPHIESVEFFLRGTGTLSEHFDSCRSNRELIEKGLYELACRALDRDPIVLSEAYGKLLDQRPKPFGFRKVDSADRVTLPVGRFVLFR